MDEEPLNQYIPVFSERGFFLVDRETGKCDTTNLNFMTHGELPILVDLEELRTEYSVLATWGYDIHDVGYWNQNGEFIPPCANWRTKRNELRDTYTTGIIELRGRQCMAA